MTTSAPCPMEGLTIGAALAAAAARRPGGDALVFPWLDERYSYAALDRAVYEAAKGLLALGLEQGSHVAIWATNVPQWPILQLAAARMGAVLVTINPAYRPHELKYVLRQCDAQALFLIDAFRSSDYYGMLAEACPELAHSSPGHLHSEAFPRLRHVIGLRGAPPRGVLPWSAFIDQGRNVDAGDLRLAEAALQPGDAINIQYTSGTTGFPKAATLTHRNLLFNGWYVGACQNISADDRICIPVPFYHCFGCVMGTLCAIAHGAAMILPAESFQAPATLDAIEQERATAVYGVPTMFIAMLEEQRKQPRNLGSLRTGIMAGSPCPIEVMKRVNDELGATELTIAYGQTEASPVVTQTRTDDTIERRVGTVGHVIPGVEVKIVDPATGATLGDNEQGELCARGHGIMIGYYGDAAATAAAIDSEGWLHTGDLAVRQPDGYFRITGRIRDLVIRGGENIYPREIEEFLFTHPAIEQASVVGLPDAKYGEELCAWIKLRDGCALDEDAVRAFCRQELAHFKTPRYVRFVGEFPQTVTGKIQKFKIREQMIAELGLEVPETA